MIEKQVVVVSTGGSAGYSMLKGIRSAGVFCTLTQADHMEIPPEAKGAVVIGEENEVALSCIRTLMQHGLLLLTFGAPTRDLCTALGGRVAESVLDTPTIQEVRFADLGVCEGVDGGMRLLQKAYTMELPQECRVLSDSAGITLGFDNGDGRMSGFQFIPDRQDVEASEIIGNFLWKQLGLQPNFTPEGFMEQAVESIRKEVGSGEALCVLTGGVDSTTTACLAKRALGEKLHCLIIDKGLERSGEIEAALQELGNLGLHPQRIDARQMVMNKLRGCITPAQKRAAVEGSVAECVQNAAARLGDNVTWIRATILGDVLEENTDSGEEGLKTVEPLCQLLKREVRAMAAQMEVPESIITRQHYPGAGIALRCMGNVDADKLDALRAADAVLQEVLLSGGQMRPGARSFALLADFSGAFGWEEKRYVVILRSVSEEGRTQRLPQDQLERAAAEITEKDNRIYRVVFDVTPTPPAHVEWE